MKACIFFGLILVIPGCSTSRKIIYSFESKNVSDSIVFTLKKNAPLFDKEYQKIKWFALLKQDLNDYSLTLEEATSSPLFSKIVKKTNRFIYVNDKLLIPVIFESDMLSFDMRKLLNGGTVNFGGFYFYIKKDNEGYRVVKTGVLF